MAVSIELTPERGRTLLDAISDAYANTDASESSRRLSLVLSTALEEGTKNAHILFASPFARMDYLCRELNYSQAERSRLNATRDQLRRAESIPEEEKKRAFPENALCVAKFIAALYGIPIPPSLAGQLPAAHQPAVRQYAFAESARMAVARWDDNFAYGELDGIGPVKLLYNTTNRFGAWGYLKKIFSENILLSLIRPARNADNTVSADLIICHPDLLTNITNITRCLTPLGSTHLWYFKELFTAPPASIHILLGNFSSQLLDASLHKQNKERVNYKENVIIFFQHNALKIALERNALQGKNFHEQSIEQLQNMQSIIANQLPELQGFNLEKVVLEPTLLCDKLGLQGRTDLLQSDYKVLIEQKSGKCDEWRSQRLSGGQLVYKKEHLAQLLLYQSMLRYGLLIPNDSISSALLYSKYPNGLVRTGPAPQLLGECIQIRNCIANLDYLLAKGNAQRLFETIRLEKFNPNNQQNTLWTTYNRPPIEEFLNTVHRASPLAQAYFYRFVTFISLERLLARTGSQSRQLDGFSAIWCASLYEKEEAGTILHDLSILSLQQAPNEKGIAEIRFAVPPREKDSDSNFRVGDIVILYSYRAGCTPDATAGLLLRGKIAQISQQEVAITLTAPQRNLSLFENSPARSWAIEHDRYDTNEPTQLQSVFSLLSAKPDRQDLLLLQRAPRIDTARTLLLDHTLPNGNPEFNALALSAKQARDFFLLVGPPGTGKTSFGLMCILREELAEPDTSVLLLSYTNRAVDEICAKLEKDGMDYLRIGSRLSCSPSYHHRLLREATKQCEKVDLVAELIDKHRVFVGTTASLLNAQELLQLKSFSLAIVDEASQLTEPNLIGLLCATRNEENAIRRFVLIGDHRQLPAVVMQSKEESAVSEKPLRDIALHDCRESLFERFYRRYSSNPQIAARLTHQGRMHPEVADFPNRFFYGARLLPVPLPHQTQQLQLISHDATPLHARLCSHRAIFFDIPTPYDNTRTRNGKSNTAEAKAIATIIEAFYSIYQDSNKPFAPARQIGVIVPYRNQIAQIRHAMRTAASRIPSEAQDAITIDTVERYQGSERDIIIYGLTLQHLFQLNFLTESRTVVEGQLIDRRLNVALTRAKEQIIIVGCAALAMQDTLYAQLVEDYQSRGAVIQWSECTQ